MSVNDNNNYQKIAYYSGDISSYLFTSTTHHQYNFNKGDIVYVKVYFYATVVRRLYIGISKTDNKDDVKTISSDYYNVDFDLDTEYHYDSGTAYQRVYKYSRSMDFSSVTLTASPNWVAWGTSFELQYGVDGLQSTNLHSKNDVPYNEENPLILYLSSTNDITFNAIYMYYKNYNYLPSSFTVEISDDNSTFTEIANYIDVTITKTEMTYSLSQFYSTKYIKITITKIFGDGYFALTTLDFRSGPFFELNPDFPDYYGTVTIENENLDLYGHSYTVHEGGKIIFTHTFKMLYIKNSFIYTCSLKVNYGYTEKTINIDENNASDFYFSIIESTSERRTVTIEILSGKFNVEMIAYL